MVRGHETIVEITPELRLQTNDLIAVVGTKENILKFERRLSS
jgi:K+/H+ antiporter YhaU regulatory subunit KhtT